MFELHVTNLACFASRKLSKCSCENGQSSVAYRVVQSKSKKMLKQFQFFVQILIVFSAEVLEIFLKLFSPQKPKIVRGRLALISGQWVKLFVVKLVLML